jgi:hypothetical protein
MSSSASPDIVTNGLVLCLDAADKKSYPGSGTTWFDRSGNGNNGTLVAGPVYSATNQGILTFDGVDDYAGVPCPQLVGKATVTVDMYTNWRSKTAGMFFGFSNYDVWTSSDTLGYNNGQSNVIGISAATVTALGLKGKFHHYVFVMNSSGNLTTNKIYIDGISVGALTAVVGGDSACVSFPSSMRICTWNSGGFNGDNAVGSFRVYDRELSPQEIKQNFKATKSKFNLL